MSERTYATDAPLGSSPRARRATIAFVGAALAMILLGQLFRPSPSEPPLGVGPVIGSELHAVETVGASVFVAGDGGASRWDAAGGWRQIESLAESDVMAWAVTSDRVWAGGHAGLFGSVDLERFEPLADTADLDVHGLGAAGRTVYVASPTSGVLLSTDSGVTFDVRSKRGGTIKGSMWVDPDDPATVLAPSAEGVVKSTDGGRTWTLLGGPAPALSVDADPSGRFLIAVGAEGSSESSADAGRSWSPLRLPPGTSAAVYTPRAAIVAAGSVGDRARVSKRNFAGTWAVLR